VRHCADAHHSSAASPSHDEPAINDHDDVDDAMAQLNAANSTIASAVNSIIGKKKVIYTVRFVRMLTLMPIRNQLQSVVPVIASTMHESLLAPIHLSRFKLDSSIKELHHWHYYAPPHRVLHHSLHCTTIFHNHN